MQQFRISSAAKALTAQHGEQYTIDFLVQQLAAAAAAMSKTKQATFRLQFEHSVGEVATVKVRNLMNPTKEIDLPWNLVGTVCDPSTERYWSM
jgi:hypothetical protein